MTIQINSDHNTDLLDMMLDYSIDNNPFDSDRIFVFVCDYPDKCSIVVDLDNHCIIIYYTDTSGTAKIKFSIDDEIIDIWLIDNCYVSEVNR